MKIPKKKKFKPVLVNLSTLTNDNLELLFESSSFLHDMRNIAYESIKFNFDKATAATAACQRSAAAPPPA